MSTSDSTVDYFLEQLVAVPTVSARKMFGDYALYCQGKVVGLICDDQLFVKITDVGKAYVGSLYAQGIPYPGAKPWMRIDEEQIENREWLGELVTVTAASLPIPKPKKKRAKKV